MGSVTVDEIPDEQRFMAELWAFRKKFYYGEDRDSFWSELIDTAEVLSQKYKNRYLDQLLIVCADDIDRRYREKRGTAPESDPVKKLYERLRK